MRQCSPDFSCTFLSYQLMRNRCGSLAPCGSSTASARKIKRKPSSNLAGRAMTVPSTNTSRLSISADKPSCRRSQPNPNAQPQIKEFLDEFGNKIEEGSTRLTTIFGSTCDGADIIYKEYPMPVELDEGNWIVWENMGAYTLAATTKFNGISFDNRRIDIV